MIVVGKGLLVILTFIAKALSENTQRARALNEQFPIIMTDFVTEMAKHSAIAFLHLLASTGSCDIIRFREIDSDAACRMAC